MISKVALRTQEKTRDEAKKILEYFPYISKNQLEDLIRKKLGHASSGTVSREYNKHRRTLCGIDAKGQTCLCFDNASTGAMQIHQRL